MDWEDIKTLNAVAQAGTVRRAALMLDVHHSTVSRRLDRLETAADARLLDRRPEGLALTEAGEALAGLAQDFGDGLNAVERRIAGRDRGLTGLVSLTMAEPIATHAFAPRLGEFREAYPGIELEILVTIDLLDVARREADIAIRMDNNPPDSLVGKRLFPYHTAVYASAAYLQRHDLNAQPQDATWIGWGEAGERYPAWTQDTAFADVPVWGNFPDVALQMAAAKAGLGIAMLPCFLADREPDLVRIAGNKPRPARDIWILTHRDLRRTARVREVMTFAQQLLVANKAHFLGTADSG